MQSGSNSALNRRDAGLGQDDVYGAVLAHGLTPLTEPRKQRPGVREFLLKDPDDNTLAFFTK